MKDNLPDHVNILIQQCRQESLAKENKFLFRACNSLASCFRDEKCPAFLSSWIKEGLNFLKEEKKARIVLVQPADGCWGISIKSKNDYLFSFNDGQENIYLSRRLFLYLSEKGAERLLAAILLHELTELLLCRKEGRKGREINWHKVHGEASRVEKAFLVNEASLTNLLEQLVEAEEERRLVRLRGSRDVYIESVVRSGEEIVAELRAIDRPGEFQIVSLAPGERKQCNLAGKQCELIAPDYAVPGGLANIDFPDYCQLLKIIDDLYISESIIESGSPWQVLTAYIKNLDFTVQWDNQLLKLLWLFCDRFQEDELRERQLLYNLYLIIDEFINYHEAKQYIDRNLWRSGRLVKDCLAEIQEQISKCKIVILEKRRDSQQRLAQQLKEWFSQGSTVPGFYHPENWPQLVELPADLARSTSGKRSLPEIKGSEEELAVHLEILRIIKKAGELMLEFRPYWGLEVRADQTICELLRVRNHFWQEMKLFARGERVGIYNRKCEGIGVVDIIEVRNDSLVISVGDRQGELPEAGYIKKLESADESVVAQIEILSKMTQAKNIAEELLTKGEETEGKSTVSQLDYYNPLVAKDKSQKQALLRACGQERLTLIQGPPGTGKTTVIAEVVLQYLKRGKRVLLVSQTHNAVDNALENIMRFSPPAAGIGRVASREEKIVDPRLRKIWLKGKRELEQFEIVHQQGLVIGATNAGTHTLALMRECQFDVLVMDEAGKSNIVESLLPMLLLRTDGKLVIVGDHQQGRPFEYEEEIIELYAMKNEFRLDRRIAVLQEKLNQSLFERMVKAGHKKLMLKMNYRSDPAIVALVSNLFYQGKLVPAKPVLHRAKSVVVVDTRRLAPADRRRETEVSGKGYKNEYEAGLVLREMKGILRYRYLSTGIRTRQIRGVTILAPYAQQVREISRTVAAGLRNILSRRSIDDLLTNITTIDSFQGRENDVIIISFTRSNNNPAQIGFLNELNRINVALSRARKKMVLIGDFSTLSNARKGRQPALTRYIFETISRYG